MRDDRTLSVGAAAPAPAAPDAVTAEAATRYDRREELGRGGMGRVVAAFDRHLGREVAVKELLDDGAPDATARFVREARVMAALEHPGIVPVHELGRRADGSLYYTMRRVRGRSFAEVLGAGPSDAERRRLLDTFVDACRAVAHAHARGVTHRDIKPANLMIGERGEALVLDWWLALVSGEEDGGGGVSPGTGSDLTVAGAVLGTPAYMSPEQARGERADPRGDCWALGTVLYEIVEGRRPDTVLRFERAPEELAAIVCRAREPAREARYPDASALLDDLLAWRDHTRVSAHRYTLWAELRRLGRRYARELVALAGALVAIAAVAGVAGQRVLAESERAARAEADLQGALARALTDRAYADLLDEDAAGALIVAAEGMRLRTSPRLRGIALAALGRDTPTLRWTAEVPPAAVAVEWGTRAGARSDETAGADWLLVTYGFHAEVWRDGVRVLTRDNDKGIQDGATFTRDGTAVWLSREDGGLERVDLATLTSRVVPTVDAPIFGDSSARRVVAIHEDGDTVWLGREDTTVDRLADGVATQAPWRTPTRRRGWADAGPGRVWLAESEDGPALRDLRDGTLLARVPFRPVHHLARVGAWWAATGRRTSGSVRIGVFDAAGTLVADGVGLAGGNDALAPVEPQGAVWVAGGAPSVRAFAVPSLTRGIAVRHGGSRAVGADWAAGRLAVVTVEGRLTVWDAPATLALVPPAIAPIHGLAIHDGVPWTLGEAGQRATWTPGPRLGEPLTDPARLFALSDGSMLASDREDLLFLDADGVATRIAGLGEIFDVAERDGQVAVGGGHQEVGVVDLATRTARWVSGHLGTDVLDVAWIGEGLRTVHRDGAVRTLSAADGAVRTVEPHPDRLVAAATSPDGRWLATATLLPPALQFYDAAGTRVAEVPLDEAVTQLVWGPGDQLFAATFDGVVSVLRGPTFAPVAEIPLEQGQIHTLAIDGATLWAAGAAGRVHRVPLDGLDAPSSAFAAEGARRFGLTFADGDVTPVER